MNARTFENWNVSADPAPGNAVGFRVQTHNSDHARADFVREYIAAGGSLDASMLAIDNDAHAAREWY